MSEGSGNVEINGQGDDRVSWIRRGGTFDSRKVTIEKVINAAERGIRIDPDASHPESVRVYKEVVQDLPGPWSWLKKMFRKK